MQFVKDQRITDSHHKRSAFIYVQTSGVYTNILHIFLDINKINYYNI